VLRDQDQEDAAYPSLSVEGVQEGISDSLSFSFFPDRSFFSSAGGADAEGFVLFLPLSLLFWMWIRFALF